MRSYLAPLAAAAAFALAACEGLVTGNEVMRMPLEQTADGGFAPVRIQLTTDMSPVALNLHGETTASATEAGRWNAYEAALTRNGAPAGAGRFNVNNTGSAEQAHGGPFQVTMLMTSVPESGEYELTIRPAKPREITVSAPQLVVRKNVEPVAR